MRDQSPPSLSFQPVRTRLQTELSTYANRAKVINLIAPVGYGKTVLMAQFLRTFAMLDIPSIGSVLMSAIPPLIECSPRFRTRWQAREAPWVLRRH